MLPVSIRRIEEEIKALERELAYKESVRPPHDHSGAYEREVFELEEALAEKRKVLVEMIQQEQGRQKDISGT
jgi:Mg2+ and Co2+ transporter CorA